MKKLQTIIVLSALSLGTQAQVFDTLEYIDIGSIKAAMGVHGNLWYTQDTSLANCQFPKASSKQINLSGGLWLGGYSNGNLHVSAHEYLNNTTDYWPGPIVNTSSPQSTHSAAQKWAKIWKVNRTDIQTFLSQSTHTVNNTPPSILEWPGEGNVNAKGAGGVSLFVPATDYNRSFAPFVDVDGNGEYDPLSGDYPDIIGDQALWTIYNDMGPTHDFTNAQALGVEIRCLAYAYHRNSKIDNVIFYKYEMVNRVGLSFDSLCVGFFQDGDLGHPFDDYIGYDSSRNLSIGYNATPVDGNGEPSSYGSMIPMSGLSLVDMPGMNGNFPKAANSYMYFSFSSGANGAPYSAIEYYYYMTSRFKNGQHLTNDYVTPGMPSAGVGNGTPANFVFNGDIGNANNWTECNAGNAPGDRRSLLSFKLDNQFVRDQVVTFSYALMATEPTTGNGCPMATSFSSLKELADTAIQVYYNPLSATTTNVSNVRQEEVAITPNPAIDKLAISLPNSSNVEVFITDVLGRKMPCIYKQNKDEIVVDIHALPQANYIITLKNNNGIYVGKFIKQ